MKNLKMKAARAGKDLSQEQLAELVGVTRQTISSTLNNLQRTILLTTKKIYLEYMLL